MLKPQYFSHLDKGTLVSFIFQNHCALNVQLLSQIRCVGSYSNFSLLAFHNLSEYFFVLKNLLEYVSIKEIGGGEVIN